MAYVNIYIIILILIWFFAPIEYLIKYTSDDSYFYLKTALNLAKGYGSTFDGINLTNGYHPLWTLLLWMVFKVSLFFNKEPEFLLRIVFILNTLISYLCLYTIFRFNKIYSISKNNYFSFTLLLIPFVFIYLIGLEVQIFLFFLTLTLLFIEKLLSHQFNRIDYFYLSISLSLLFLARIDLFFYSFIAIVVFIYTYDKKLLTHFYKLIILPFLSVIIYLIINKIVFGEFFLISGKYKLSENIISNLKFFPTPFGNPIDFIILALIIVSGALYYIFKGKIKLCKEFNLILNIYYSSIIFLIVNFVFNHNGAREWYYTYSLFPALLLVYTVLKHLIKTKYLVAILIFMNLFYLLVFRNNYYNHESALEFAKRINQSTSSDDVIYQVDYSGLVSFFSDRRIINGDGLINSYEYYKYVKSGNLKEYLDKKNPKYLSFYSFENPIKNDSIFYRFRLFKDYFIKEKDSNIILVSPFIYGGIFRKKTGNFYLVKIDEWNVSAN